MSQDARTAAEQKVRKSRESKREQYGERSEAMTRGHFPNAVQVARKWQCHQADW